MVKSFGWLLVAGSVVSGGASAALAGGSCVCQGSAPAASAAAPAPQTAQANQANRRYSYQPNGNYYMQRGVNNYRATNGPLRPAASKALGNY